MVLINPGSTGEAGSRNPSYLAKNPGGTIPTIEEPDTGLWGIVRLTGSDLKNLQSKALRLQVGTTRPGRRLELV